MRDPQYLSTLAWKQLTHYWKPEKHISSDSYCESKLNANTFWKIMLVSSILVAVFGLYMFRNLDFSVSGDGIPNSPQGGPSPGYPWSQVISLAVVIGASSITAIYSLMKVFRRP